MKNPESKSKLPILIVDRKGVLAEYLIKSLKDEFLPVVLSSKKPQVSAEKIVYIHLRKKIPKLPENHFPYIFFIDSGDDYVRRLIEPLRKYGAKHGSVLTIVTSIYYKKIKNLDGLTRDRQIKTFVAGDIFDFSFSDSETGKIILSAKRGKISLLGQGLLEYLPVSSFELGRSIVKNMSVGLAARNLFLIFPTHPLTGLSIARALTGFYPDSKIDVQNKKVKNGPLWMPSAGEYMELKSFPEQLEEVLGEKEVEGEQVSERKSRPVLPVIASLGFFLVLFFILPLVVLLGLFFSGSLMTKQAASELEKGNSVSAKNWAYQANNSFELSDSIAKSFLPVAKAVGRGRSIESFSGQISTLKKVDLVIVDLASAIEEFEASQKESDAKRAKSLFVSSSNRLSTVFTALNSLDAEGEVPSQYREKLEIYQKLGRGYLAVKEVLPNVLGFEGEKKYLVLFQNNNELRPGGGFIGSYGILDVKQGSIKDLKIFDVYDADGQLTAHVEPPFPLKEHLGASNWFLRDSNFAVDFPENAARAAYFLRLETGEEVDGVIAIDTTFIQELLQKTGSVKVLDFDKTIDSNNFSELLQSEIEDEFFPGSQKKKQLLTGVYNNIREKAEQNMLGLGDVFLKSLSEKHLLFAFADPDIQAPFTLANFSGALWDGRENDENTINDFLGIVEANLGENKVNPYIERQISQETALQDDGELTSLVGISYKNNSKPGDRFGGSYENYLRLVYPFSANAIGLKIDGVEKTILPSVQGEAGQRERQRVSEEVVSVDLGEEKGKKTLGMIVNVPPGETKKIEILFQTQTDFTRLDPDVKYNLVLFKQPGRLKDPYLFKFSFPQGYQVVSKSDNVEVKGDEATAFFLLNEDKELEVTLGKK